MGSWTLFFFQEAISSFGVTEEARLEVLFPLVSLDNSITDATLFVENLDPAQLKSQPTRGELEVLKRAIDRDLMMVAQMPVQISVQQSLLTSIEKNINQGFESLHQFWVDPALENPRERLMQQRQAQRYFQDALTGVRTIHYSLTSWSARENMQKVEAMKRQFRLMILIFILMLLVITMVSAWFITRSILKPVGQLKAGLYHFREGDLGFRIHLETEDELAQLATAMNAMAQRLEESQQQLQRLATLDGLTELLNRREFNRILKMEIERALRENQPVSMIMVDLDHFKALNDRYGHQSGDEALRYVSALLRREIRPCDHAARFGGEEFALILPNADLEEAQVVANRLCLGIAAGAIRLSEALSVQVTASLGCATFPSTASSEHALLTQADQALYRAKAGGRNQVCLAPRALAAEGATTLKGRLNR
ncbi:sensor domain-containing diguanylate cyclase [Lyngbya confervoides]|uniref:Diguanylate cyclase n=1 Tax=Lyngbya confervoides BDU141951 TaxID=1574623 RepID=A0ABD4T9R9_9CYAN|nr:sensor domain-containing diguanylate cyclase [Lyngbya confervoides]MCM1985163.1 diguanylate cyclase [Lyngbya confervoides BDU141951]